MKELTYTYPPKSLEEAQERANDLAEYVESITGVKWGTRVHENLGFHYKVFLGSITIHSQSYPDKTKYSIYNSGPSKWIGTGHAEVNVINCDINGLSESLTQAIRDIFKVIDDWNNVLTAVSGMKQTKEIIEERKRF